MSETPATDQAAAPDIDQAETPDQDAQAVHCRHCGQPSDEPHAAGEDWLCAACDRYQDAVICPTCGGLARISLMPEGIVPEPHAPARRRKAKE